MTSPSIEFTALPPWRVNLVYARVGVNPKAAVSRTRAYPRPGGYDYDMRVTGPQELIDLLQSMKDRWDKS